MTPQITIFLDSSGALHAESPGRNGARHRVELPLDLATRNPELVAELQAQVEAERARLEAEHRARERSNIAYCLEFHPRLAQKIWKDALARKQPKPTIDLTELGLV